MFKSMTGFGKAQNNNADYYLDIEIKGLNHRYLDFNLRMSRRYAALEERIKEDIKSKIFRGRVEISLNIEKNQASARKIKLDKELAMAYYESLKDLAKHLQLASDFRTVDLFRMPEVYTLAEAEEDLEELWMLIQPALQTALEDFMQMRAKEGLALDQDIRQRLQVVLKEIDLLELRAPKIIEDYKEKLEKRLEQFIANQALDEQRLLVEVALFAEKANINEEIVRLKSHIEQLFKSREIEGAVGKKLDFLCQEMFREANTIAAKSNDLESSQRVLEIKAELEKIREQIQNIE